MFDLLPSLLENDLFFNWIGDLMHAEVSKMTLAFIVAARLHRGWVKKDMEVQFLTITSAIDNVADKVAKGLELHSKRIDELHDRVAKLEKR